MLFLQEKLSVLDFVDTSTSEPIEPLPIEVTPFTLVEDVKDLKLLAQKLRSVNEFAVKLSFVNPIITVRLINLFCMQASRAHSFELEFLSS